MLIISGLLLACISQADVLSSFLIVAEAQDHSQPSLLLLLNISPAWSGPLNMHCLLMYKLPSSPISRPQSHISTVDDCLGHAASCGADI